MAAISPSATLAIALAASGALMLLPARWTAAPEGALATALRPAQELVLASVHRAEQIIASAERHLETTEQLAEAQEEIDRLKEDNRRLAVKLAEAEAVADRPAGDHSSPDDRLLRARCVTARVLGQQARAFLARREIINAGSLRGMAPGILALDARSTVIDRGGDAQLEPGRLVLAGSRIWGRVVDVGPYTSTVMRVTEAGYRDVVRLAPSQTPAGPVWLGPEAVLEGTGQPLARVRLVDVTEPVEVGDRVYAESTKGVLGQPLLYGHVKRVERPVGAAHWEIWMEPAAADRPEEVAVLKIEWNALRVGQRSPATDRGTTGASR